jgi:hypothetical protein
VKVHVPFVTVCDSLLEWKWRVTWIPFGVRMKSCIAFVFSSTWTTARSGDASPSSGRIFSHLRSAYGWNCAIPSAFPS